MLEMQRFLLVPDRRGLRRQKIDQHRPDNRPQSTHIARFLMVVGRPDPNSSVQCEIARDPPPMGRVGAIWKSVLVVLSCWSILFEFYIKIDSKMFFNRYVKNYFRKCSWTFSVVQFLVVVFLFFVFS